MGILIAVGSAISYIASILLADPMIPADVVGQVALASCAAFAISEFVDSITYAGLKNLGWKWFERSNGSNFPAAAIDSIVFVVIAFGWDWQIAFAQCGAKVGGALLWSMIIEKWRSIR